MTGTQPAPSAARLHSQEMSTSPARKANRLDARLDVAVDARPQFQVPFPGRAVIAPKAQSVRGIISTKHNSAYGHYVMLKAFHSQRIWRWNRRPRNESLLRAWRKHQFSACHHLQTGSPREEKTRLIGMLLHDRAAGHHATAPANALCPILRRGKTNRSYHTITHTRDQSSCLARHRKTPNTRRVFKVQTALIATSLGHQSLARVFPWCAAMYVL